MTKENKELLLKYLCMASPYNVYIMGDIDKIFDGGIISTLKSVDIERELIELKSVITPFLIDEVKPYLRQLSSMTEEEKEVYKNIDNRSYSCPMDYAHIPASDRINWLLKNHFDFMGLVPKGVGIAVTKDNNPYEQNKL